jgi:hypothetical protein
MPRFLDPDNPSLNLYVKAKKVVVKRSKKKYEGADPAFQAEMAALGQKQEGANVVYESLLALLTNIVSSSLEVRSAIQLAANAREGRLGFADRFLAGNSALIKLVGQLQQQMQKLNFIFNIFSPEQAEELKSKYEYANRIINESSEMIADIRTRRNKEWVGDAWDQLTPSWYNVWVQLSQKMEAGFKSYKYGLSSVRVAAGRRSKSDRVVGGQGPAGREPFQFTTFASGLGPFPPRNTQDLRDLPRRFL